MPQFYLYIKNKEQKHSGSLTFNFWEDTLLIICDIFMGNEVQVFTGMTA